MSAYYNEHEPFAAQWLRNLIAAGHIAAGDVDERDIQDVQPDDLRGYSQCHFFAGIGGWSYALRLGGWDDTEPVWTGSCPCQPYSGAGHQQGAADPRNLWPHWFRLIRECRPGRVFGEQVDRAVGHGWLDAVSTDLEAEGYAIGACVLGAHSLGAPHARPRLWFVAHTSGEGLPERAAFARGVSAPPPPPAWSEFERVHGTNAWARWDAESEVRVFAHGVSAVGGKLRAFGNAISPHVAAEFIGAYVEVVSGRSGATARERGGRPVSTTKGTAELLALKKRIEAMSLGDQLRLVAGLLDLGGKDDIAETLASNVVDELRARRVLGRHRTW